MIQRLKNKKRHKTCFHSLSIIFILLITITHASNFVEAKPSSFPSSSPHTQTTAVAFHSIDINYWPEYDNQYMFVRIRGILDPATPLPAKLRFTLPYNSALMNYISVENLSGQKIYLPYEESRQGTNQIIEFTVDTLQFEITFHDESFTTIANQRFYNANLQFDYPIEELNLIFQQPKTAQEIQINPTPQTEFIGLHDLIYHVITLEDYQPNQSIPFELNYSKEDNQLTYNYVEPILANQRTNTLITVVTVIASVGVLLIIALSFYLYRVARRENKTIRNTLKISKNKKD